MADPKSRLAGLTKEEWEDYLGLKGYACVHKALDTSSVDRLVDQLAACRALLEKIDKNTGSDGWVLLSAEDLDRIHKALEGTEGGE